MNYKILFTILLATKPSAAMDIPGVTYLKRALLKENNLPGFIVNSEKKVDSIGTKAIAAPATASAAIDYSAKKKANDPIQLKIGYDVQHSAVAAIILGIWVNILASKIKLYDLRLRHPSTLGEDLFKPAFKRLYASSFLAYLAYRHGLRAWKFFKEDNNLRVLVGRSPHRPTGSWDYEY